MLSSAEEWQLTEKSTHKEKKNYLYNEILQHASGVANSASDKRSAKERANHLALEMYLENYLLAGDASSNLVDARLADDGRYVGQSGSKLRDEFISRGFNPIGVHPLWNFRGHSETAVLEFNKGWPGLHNALLFEKAHETDHHGKKDWLANNDQKSGLYTWVARADDCKSTNIVGEHLQNIGDLTTVSEIMEEEARKQKKNLFQLESQKRELQFRGTELERNTSLQLAALELKRADENVMKLAEDQKLEKKLDIQQAIELEIERLRGTLNVMRHMGADGDEEVMKMVEVILIETRMKEGEFDDLEALNQTLIVKEHKSNDELQDARQELINVSKPFYEAMKKKIKPWSCAHYGRNISRTQIGILIKLVWLRRKLSKCRHTISLLLPFKYLQTKMRQEMCMKFYAYTIACYFKHSAGCLNHVSSYVCSLCRDVNLMIFIEDPSEIEVVKENFSVESAKAEAYALKLCKC
ncbi:hypothetical protein FNV43_RR25562 [Rhamnella rubrinervis]|uniref:Uncharacterized protein n=1 Tax=Rhamnella rubrinervis TaxID=2594499 RepID=A0A8K0DUF0_9ROSA|nr:hypothetical protein FNV43_RR25562 [Rhamnella rubrinervis]